MPEAKVPTVRDKGLDRTIRGGRSAGFAARSGPERAEAHAWSCAGHPDLTGKPRPENGQATPGKTSATQAAGITASISPHTLRHFLFTWLKTQGIDDALIQPYSGHATRQSLEIYSRLALADAQQRYDDVIGNFPV